MEFPDDENGQVLRRMFEVGDDLTTPRPIDFEHVLCGHEDGWGCLQPE